MIGCLLSESYLLPFKDMSCLLQRMDLSPNAQFSDPCHIPFANEQTTIQYGNN